jgi:hypothetical protein
MVTVRTFVADTDGVVSVLFTEQGTWGTHTPIWDTLPVFLTVT